MPQQADHVWECQLLNSLCSPFHLSVAVSWPSWFTRIICFKCFLSNISYTWCIFRLCLFVSNKDKVLHYSRYGHDFHTSIQENTSGLESSLHRDPELCWSLVAGWDKASGGCSNQIAFLGRIRQLRATFSQIWLRSFSQWWPQHNQMRNM